MRSPFRSHVLLCVFCVSLLCGCAGSTTSSTGGGGPRAALSVTSVSPATLPVASVATLTVNGTGFTQSTIVSVNGTALPTSFISTTQVTASVAAGQFSTAGSFHVSVSDGGASASTPTVVVEVDNPKPAISALNPASAVAGTGSTDVTLAGSGFVAGTVVQVNGAPRTTTFTSDTHLTVTLTSADLASAGSLAVTAVNAAPGGGTSPAAAFTVTSPAPVPTLASATPAAIYRTSTSTTLTLQGTGFQPASTVLWNGKAFSTTFISTTQLSIAVAQADLPSAGSATLQVSTPAPGGGQSAILTVPIYPFKPTITAVQETIVGTSCQQIQLSIIGQNLPTSSIVAMVNGVTVPNVSSLTPTLMQVRLPANLGVLNNAQLTLQSTLMPGAVSDPFTLEPKSSVCFAPASIASVPGATFGIDASMTVLSTDPVTVSALTLPAGFAATIAAPYTIPSRIYVSTDASVATGTYSIGLTPSGTAAAVTLPVNLTSTAPSFSFLGPLVSAVAVHVGGTSKVSVSTYSTASTNGTPDFRITLNATGLPQGVTASFQPSAVVPGDSFTVTLTAAANAPVRQNVPISILGTIDGTSISASLPLTLNVAPVPGTIPDNRTAYTWTGGTPNSVAYDRVHKLIFASNPDWNRIDVISPSTHAILRSIPVASPVMIDLSQDSNTLWIGTQSEQVYALNTSAFTLRTYALPATTSTFPNQANLWTVSELYALADGNLLIVGANTFVWSPSTGAWTVVSLPNGLMRSPDGTRVFGLTSGFSGCLLNVYSTATSTATTYTIDSGFTGSAYCGTLEAANHDGSMLVASLTAASLRGIQLLSGTGQSLGSFTAAVASGSLAVSETVYFFPSTFVFSDDGSTLYQTGTWAAPGNLIATYDVASRKLLGLAPAISSPTPPMSSGYGGNTMLVAADPSGLLIGIQSGGVAFEDSTYFQDYGSGNGTIPGGNPTVFSPQSGPLAGGASFSVYPMITLQPDVWYGDVRGTAALSSSNSLTLTSPPAEVPGPVDLKLIYPDGTLGYGALAFSYGPSPHTLLYNASAPAGGGLSTLTGFGLPVDSSTGSISVGGSGAPITSTVGQYPPWTGEVVPTTFVKFTLPAGRPGYSDLQVQTPNGVATLPKAVFYASSVNDYSFSGTASSVLYDKFRKRVYVITKNAVQVFDATSGGFLTPITPPTVNGVSDLRDGALSIDGTFLVLGNAGDGSVAVLNLDAPTSSYALALPALTSITPNCTIGPGAIAPLANNKALVLPTVSSSQCGILSTSAVIDLQARTQTTPLGNTAYYCPSGFWYAQAQSNADGTQAVVNTGNGSGACFYFPSTGYAASGSLSSYFGVSIAADGNVLNGSRFTDPAGKPLGNLAQPAALYGSALTPTYPADSRTVQLSGARFNASGGLHFEPHAGYFEIVDTATATLRMRFSLTQTVQNVVNPMAIDEGGRQIFLLTDAGLTVVDLGQALLSVGHLDSTQTVSGGTVQVRGSGFDATTTVTVDSAAAVVHYVDENT